MEAARRKALREAKKKEQEALNAASKSKTAEEVEAELQVSPKLRFRNYICNMYNI